ncbi:hypothetical protein Agub_g8419, partial [Astrephomene gubernaculifera]
MHALLAALTARRDAASPAVAELLAALEQAGPELTEMDVQISSFGGVGSTQLSNHLNAYGITTNLLTDADNLRHCPRPPVYDNTNTASTSGSSGSSHVRRPRHVVYLYGDPLAAVASHYRRGHACHQAQKTCGQPSCLSPATFPPSFEEYVSRGEDLFGLEAHFHNWLTARLEYPLVMLRYERMFEPGVASRLFQLLAGHKLCAPQLQRMTREFVASHRPRRSQVPAEYYRRMYGSLLAEMDRLPPLLIRGAGASAPITEADTQPP